MFSSTILDLAIGLVFTFLSISLASSAITEAIASFMKLRSTTLRAGIKDLLNDTSGHGELTGLALALYKNALVSPRSDGKSGPPRRRLPTYIDPQHFARALMQETGLSGATMTPGLLKLRISNSQFLKDDQQLRTLFEEIVHRTANMTVDIQKLRNSIAGLPATETVTDDLKQILRDIVNRTEGQPSDAAELRNRIAKQQDLGLRNTLSAMVDGTTNIVDVAGDPATIKARIATVIQDKQLRDLLDGVVDRTAGSLQRIEDELAHWFDSSMDRISGVYKRMTQWISLGFALVLVAILNVSAIDVAERLWKQPIDTARIAQVKAEDIKDPEAARLFLDKLNDVGALSSSIGWQNPDKVKKFLTALFSQSFDAWTRVLGWVITALATLFGAPFWFDTLQQIIRLKGSGPSPVEKILNKGAAA